MIIEKTVPVTNKIVLLRHFNATLVDLWWDDINSWINTHSQDKAIDTLANINSGSNILAAVDNDMHLLAVSSYMTITSKLRLSMLKGIPKEVTPFELETLIRKNGVLFIYRLAGCGVGGGKEIIRAIQAVSQDQNTPIYLNSTDIAMTFYERMGFIRIGDTNHYYWIG